MLEDEINQILTKLGFTSSQAKIYLALSKLDKSKVNAVAKNAQLDRAETYRVIAQLEEKGFLEKIITHPIEYKAIPIEQLLPILFQKKKDEIAQIEKQTTQLLQHSTDEKITLEQEEYIRFAPRAEMVFSEIKQDNDNAERSIDIITSIEMIKEIGHSTVKQTFLKALKKGVKKTIILEKPCGPDAKELTKYHNSILRFLPSPSDVFLVILDDTKVWIKTSSFGYFESSWLISNNRHIVAFARSYFKKALQESTET